ncbi:MAG: hypothetical protein AB8G05_19470 [Oligoflexales bacterium]
MKFKKLYLCIFLFSSAFQVNAMPIKSVLLLMPLYSLVDARLSFFNIPTESLDNEENFTNEVAGFEGIQKHVEKKFRKVQDQEQELLKVMEEDQEFLRRLISDSYSYSYSFSY